MNVFVPLIEAATLEEDNDLQDAWAAMLVNAANTNSDVEIRRMFISILQDMNSIDVKCMEKISSVYDPTLVERRLNIMTYMLPERAVVASDIDGTPMPPNNVAIAIRNLMRSWVCNWRVDGGRSNRQSCLAY